MGDPEELEDALGPAVTPPMTCERLLNTESQSGSWTELTWYVTLHGFEHFEILQSHYSCDASAAA